MATGSTETRQEVRIDAGDATLNGFLDIPVNARGLVLFAHGSGSSRFSSRNRAVAAVLSQAGLATLLFDLLTPREDEVDRFTREYRFDIPLISRRLTGAMDWTQTQPALAHLPLGLFGASTGAAAALNAAAERPDIVRAVVSRGGRPDLAARLSRVKAPTLLIVGGLDAPVIDMNQQAGQQLQCPWELKIVQGATHLFEEAGKLQEVEMLAREWFLEKLARQT